MTSVTSTFSLAYLEAIRDVQLQMVAALALLVWDVFWTLEEEVEYIWRMRCCVFKWLYFYFRYFLLVAQIFHLAVLPSLSSGHMSDFLCVVWGQYVVFIMQISGCMIEFILAVRVFALFNRSRKVGVFLSSLILSEVGVAVLIIVRGSTAEYVEACILLRPHKEMANLFTCITMIVQSIIMGMLVFKHHVGIRLGWGRTPLSSVLVKDAMSYYVMVFLLCGILMVVCGFDDLRITAILYWSMSLYSAFGCRLILNMGHFVRRDPPDEEIQFTSIISL